MDPVVLCCVAVVVIIFILIGLKVYTLFVRSPTEINEGQAVAQRPQPAQRAPLIVGGRRQVALRRRPGAAASENSRKRPDDSNEEDSGSDVAEDADNWQDDLALPEGKIGKKKLAKLQAKSEKRAQREAEVDEREERRKREAEKEARRLRDAEREKQEEQAKEDAERKAKEEKERQEYEEYLKMKEAFSVEEEGFDQVEADEAENLLQEFVNFVKNTKVVNMEELGVKFKLRPQEVVDRIKTLVGDGTLTGVIDDRGKFIYITTDELKAVAKFINQRGRVSVNELAEYSNKLIKLEPETCAATQ